MIQINLLPDVKQEYLRARRTRNMAISMSILAGIGSVAVVVLLLIVLGIQAGREVLADNGIKSEYQSLSKVSDISELVTLQNQLDKIGSQHEVKSMNSRLFNTLQAINPSKPNNVQFTGVILDPETETLRLEGVAEGGYPAVETLKKTIQNTDIEFVSNQQTVTEDISTKVAVGETSFGDDSQGRRVLRFEVFVTYNPLLFSNEAKSVEVQAPDRRINVTDSRIGIPDSLFTAPIEEAEGVQ